MEVGFLHYVRPGTINWMRSLPGTQDLLDFSQNWSRIARFLLGDSLNVRVVMRQTFAPQFVAAIWGRRLARFSNGPDGGLHLMDFGKAERYHHCPSAFSKSVRQTRYKACTSSIIALDSDHPSTEISASPIINGQILIFLGVSE
jgi:hypothetical protein